MNAAINQSKLFVAITDELLYEHPEVIDTPLIPYASDMQCHRWLDVEINPDETDQQDIDQLNVKQFAA